MRGGWRIAAVAAVTIVALVGCTDSSPVDQPHPAAAPPLPARATASTFPSPGPLPYTPSTVHWPAELVSITDGDTQRMIVDLGEGTPAGDQYLGFHVWIMGHHMFTEVSLRDEGFNANEHGTTGGDAATKWAGEWFQAHTGPYTLTTHQTPAGALDKYGRFLATVTARDGREYNTDIIRAGYGLPYNGTGPRPTPAYPPVPDPTSSPLYR